MVLLDTAKEALKLAKKVGNIPLQQSIIDLQEQVLEMQEKHKSAAQQLQEQAENLSQENTRLEEALNQHGDMKKAHGHLWELIKGEVNDGPFCITCWEIGHKKLSLVQAPNYVDVMCPKCKFPMPHCNPPKEWKDARQI